MGYTTEFYGTFKLNKALDDDLFNYLNKFTETRRMKRDVEKIKEVFPDWEKLCYNGNLGVDGEFFVGGKGFMGQENDDSVIDGNYPPTTQPGLWCQWYASDNSTIEWDGGEKFYDYEYWLQYIKG